MDMINLAPVVYSCVRKMITTEKNEFEIVNS